MRKAEESKSFDSAMSRDDKADATVRDAARCNVWYMPWLLWVVAREKTVYCWDKKNVTLHPNLTI